MKIFHKSDQPQCASWLDVSCLFQRLTLLIPLLMSEGLFVQMSMFLPYFVSSHTWRCGMINAPFVTSHFCQKMNHWCTISDVWMMSFRLGVGLFIFRQSICLFFPFNSTMVLKPCLHSIKEIFSDFGKKKKKGCKKPPPKIEVLAWSGNDT